MMIFHGKKDVHNIYILTESRKVPLLIRLLAARLAGDGQRQKECKKSAINRGTHDFFRLPFLLLVFNIYCSSFRAFIFGRLGS
jgi:hypothetical protein